MVREIDANPERKKFRTKTGTPVQCTGGVSYFVVRGDGKIYRCLYNPTVIGHIDQGLPQLPLHGMSCLHRNMHEDLDKTCHPSGDLMFATYWENGKKYEATWRDTTWGEEWNESDDPAYCVRDKAFIIVLPVNSKCNLRCTYCCNFYYETDDGRIVGREKDHDQDLPVEQYQKFIDDCGRKLKFCHFGFLGGEPTLYTQMPEFIQYIINVHEFEAGICSNMINTAVFEKIAETVHTDKSHLMSFSASLHPSSPGFKWEDYFYSVKICVEAGFRCRATMVSWPEQTYSYEYYKAKLESIGVPLWLKGCGGYDFPNLDWSYISNKGGTKQTYDALRDIKWINPPRD